MKKIVLLMSLMGISPVLFGADTGQADDADRIIRALDAFQQGQGPNPGVPAVRRVANDIESDSEEDPDTQPASTTRPCPEQFKIKKDVRTQ
jgi:hypothetical protein